MEMESLTSFRNWEAFVVARLEDKTLEVYTFAEALWRH